MLSHVQLFVVTWTAAHQVPRSMGILQVGILEWAAIAFSRGSSQPRDEPRSPALKVDSLPTEPMMQLINNKVWITHTHKISQTQSQFSWGSRTSSTRQWCLKSGYWSFLGTRDGETPAGVTRFYRLRNQALGKLPKVMHTQLLSSGARGQTQGLHTKSHEINSLNPFPTVSEGRLTR